MRGAFCVACDLVADKRVPAVALREIPMNEAPNGPQPVCEECREELDREDMR